MTNHEITPAARRRVQYQPSPGPDWHPPLTRQILAQLAAPFRGSRVLFPARLAKAVEAHRLGRPPIRIGNASARRYFGRSLILWISPADLRLRLADRVHDGLRKIQLSERFLDGEDWNPITTPVERLVEHQEITELVEYGSLYAEMPSCRRMLARLARGKPVMRFGARLDTEAKVHAYFRKYLNLIESVRSRGMLEVGAMRAAAPPSRMGFLVRRERNIGAAIGSDGQLLRFLGGRHRTAIAQGLGLARVPVEIRLVHTEWICAESERTGLSADAALRRWARGNSLRAATAS